MLLFVGWALSVTLLISVRYDYSDNYYLLFSLLKLGKFVLYGVAGLLTARALVNDRIRQEFVRSLAVAGVFVGIALFFVGQKSTATAETSALGYKASNGVSVMAALIACYLCGLWMRRKAENKWNNWLMVSLGLLGCGFGKFRGARGVGCGHRWICILVLSGRLPTEITPDGSGCAYIHSSLICLLSGFSKTSGSHLVRTAIRGRRN
jgi:cell division protein FtsW (lipid II flippase)